MTLSARCLFATAASVSLLVAACAPDTAAPTEGSRGASLRVEDAARNAELGKDTATSRATLQTARHDPSLPAVEREDASLALADLLEAEGDRAGAISVLEDFLAEDQTRGNEHRTDRSQRRLRELLGAPEPKRRDLPGDRGTRTFAPVTRALAEAFPPEIGKKRTIRSLVIGGTGEPATHLGTYNLAGAIEARATETCSLCDLPDLRYSSSHDGSFLGLVRERDATKTALVVIYYDREEGRVPDRYESFFALPVADLNARLDRGEGVIAVKRRDGAPPLVMLAAPRRAQLAAVDETFAALPSLPEAPVAVKVSPALSADEIQLVVRGAKGAYKACYESHLTKSPTAAGKITLSFAITPEGKVEGVNTTGTGTVADDEVLACFRAATGTLSFPATRTTAPTTVKYPFELSP